jgi:excisionase family DNA binding protein
MSIYEKCPTLQLSDSDVRALAHSLETLPARGSQGERGRGASGTEASDTQASDTQASDTQASDTQASDTQASDTQASDGGLHSRSLVIDGHALDVSDDIVQSVVDMLTRLAEGKGVLVGSVDELMTTGQTAEFLGISRTYVIQLIDKGLLTAEYRGTHRRITMGSAIAHAKRTQQLQNRSR